MAHRLRLVVLALAALAASAAHAGYAQLAPPAGFGGSPAGWTFAPSANDSTFGRVIHQPNGLKVPVPGTQATMPAAYRLAANAPRVAAAIIYTHPLVRTGVGIAAWLAGAGILYNAVNNSWESAGQPGQDYHVSNGKEYQAAAGGPWFPSLYHAVLYRVAQNDSSFESWNLINCGPNSCQIRSTRKSDGSFLYNFDLGPYDIRASTTCPSGWYITPGGVCSQNPIHKQLTEQEMVELLNPANQPGWPMPSTVPGELPPGTPLPVEQPVINPAPGPDPQPRPLFVPTGDPVPNPNYDPNAPLSPANQPWKQPGVRVVPSPTLNEPWRVDIQPTDRLVPGPEPFPEPIPEGEPNPSDKPKPEEQQSLCEKHPDVVACAKIGTVEAVPVANERKQLSISKDTGYGPESGTCPAPKTVTVMGRTLEFKYDLLCDFAGYIKPLLIAFAWLSAALTFFGFSRKDS